jgi:glyoxylase-like metal-dependent hydrolase (beta-lactamase superfamily II)
MTDDVFPRPNVRGVAAFSTGRVQIHPQHVHGSRLPSLAWILLSPTWGAWRPIHVFVIEHERGLVLFDAGQDRASLTDPDYYPSSALMRLIYRRLARFEIGPDETVSAQLDALGYRVEDVRWVVLSHLHQDHIGGLRELTGARFVVSSTEWQAMEAPNSEMAGFLPRHTDLPGATWDPVAFEPTTDAALAPFSTAHDLLGDGSLVLLPTPGHTTGSMSMLVRGRDVPLLLVGDLSYDVEGMRHGLLPGIGSRATLRETSGRVLELERRSGGLAILPAHDRAAATRLAAAGGRVGSSLP